MQRQARAWGVKEHGCPSLSSSGHYLPSCHGLSLPGAPDLACQWTLAEWTEAKPVEVLCAWDLLEFSESGTQTYLCVWIPRVVWCYIPWPPVQREDTPYVASCHLLSWSFYMPSVQLPKAHWSQRLSALLGLSPCDVWGSLSLWPHFLGATSSGVAWLCFLLGPPVKLIGKTGRRWLNE